MKSNNKTLYNNYAFIDSQNLNLGVRSLGWQLDFKKFRTYLRHRFRVKKAFLFIGYIESNQKLYDFLEKAGYILIFKPTVKAGGVIKGNVDAELVLHAMIELDNYEKAVIVSGDGDFCCLIKYLDEQNKLETIIVPNLKKYSSLLREFSQRGLIYFLNDAKKRLGRK